MNVLAFLQNIWFIIIGVLFIGYSILDGFDLGLGMLLPFLAKKENDKKLLFNSITPVWDGNEVWLLTAGGALFAAFPQAYATVFSGFYLALMLVLFALIFRAVSLEFWKQDEKRQKFWECAFIIGSFLPALLYGVALGTIIVGVPLNENMEFTGNFFTLLRPFPLITGLLGMAAFLMQGSAYAILKTSAELQATAKKALHTIWVAFMVIFVLSFVLAAVYLSSVITNFLAWLACAIVVAGWYMVKISLAKSKYGLVFLNSSLSLVGLWGIVGAIQFPNLVNAKDRTLSITIQNGSNSQLTLTVMLIITLIGLPLVIFYTVYVYRVFRGKAVLDGNGY